MNLNNKETLEKANKFVYEGDNEGFLSFCTDDTAWIFIGDKTLLGKESVRQYMAMEYKNPPVFKVDNLIAEGDFVTATGQITIKDAKGEKTDYSYCDVWRFRDGKMAQLKAYVIKIEPK